MNVERVLKRYLSQLLKLLYSHRRTVFTITLTTAIAVSSTTLIAIVLYRTANVYFPNIGSIKTLGVEAYWNFSTTERATEIAWGPIYPSSEKSVDIYFRSISNTNVTLVMKAENWILFDSNETIVYGPNQTSPYMILTWSYNNETMQPGEVKQVTLTLTATDSPDFVEFIVTNGVRHFSFDITIEAQEPA